MRAFSVRKTYVKRAIGFAVAIVSKNPSEMHGFGRLKRSKIMVSPRASSKNNGLTKEFALGFKYSLEIRGLGLKILDRGG